MNPGRFGPGSFRPGSFRPGSFRPNFGAGRFGLVSWVVSALSRFANKECGLVIIILILLVKFVYSIEYLAQHISCRQYRKTTFRTRIALDDELFD